MSTKKCSCCGIEKRPEDFQVRRASHDGRTASCRDCLRDRDRTRYPKERAQRLELMRAYQQTEAGKAALRKGHLKHWNAHPEKRRAHAAVSNAVRSGRLRREPCACCGVDNVEAHHPDYSAPLSVVWLCTEHHKQLHYEHEPSCG